MKNRCTFFSVLFILLCAGASAQVIPDSLRADWSHAGFQGAIPDTSFIINVKDFGAYGDSIHDDYNAIMNAMNSSTAFRILYFPAGNYLIKTSIAPSSNVVFRGDGVSSNIIFNLGTSGNPDGFNISANQINAFTGIDSGYNKGSTILNISNTAGLTPGSFAEIRQANGTWNTVPAAWATYCVGQMVTIKAVNGNIVTIEPALRITYTDSLHPEIRPVTLRTNVGIECLKITRADTIVNGRYGYNIDFTYAANCWVTGIESSKSQGSHIMLTSSKNITISGSYLHDAFTYDGTSTAGYGITMIQHNSDCKVENCILKHLRHSMIAKQGANGNVFAYNYSLDPNRSETPHDAGGDMVLHGHYPFANLFEGNIGQTITVDDTWGAAGPYNTFFRNRAELYGVIFSDQYVNTIKENVVGTEVTSNSFLKGNYILLTSKQFTYDNNIKGLIQPANTNVLNDASYYLANKPYFWNVNSTWPSIGGSNSLGSGSNPAKERYLSGGPKTSCLKEPAANPLQITISADSIKCYGSATHILISATGGVSPHNGAGDFYKPAGTYSFIVTDAFGNSDTATLTLNQPLPVSAVVNTTPTQSCNQTGAISITGINGGSKPYLFSLNNVDYIADSTYYNLAYGSYNAYVKDSVGCIDTIQNISVESVPTITITATATKASSCRNDATITIKQKGGTPPLQYSLNNIDYYNSNNFTNTAPGIYTAWVRDKNKCIDSLTGITVTQLTALKITAKKTDLTCKNSDNGTITLTAQGGLKPYLYTIDSINYTSNNVFTNLTPGTYKSGFKDAKSCSIFSTVTIRNSRTSCVIAASTNNNLQLNNDLKVVVAPNPSTNEFTLTINNHVAEKTALVVTDMFGSVVYKTNGETKNKYVFGEAFLPGIYILKLIQGDAISTYKLVKQ